MHAADIRKVKKLAQRLGVRDSDIIRFALKCTLSRLGPLNDPEAKGRNLVPVFVESGAELLRFFELDAARLEAIINEGADPMRKVEREDIALLAMTGAPEPYAALMLSELNRDDRQKERTGEVSESIRQYLYTKYMFRMGGVPSSSDEPARLPPETLQLAIPGAHHE
jgi:hypothetical protein